MPKQTSMMAKKQLKWMPLLGQFMTLSGAVFVDRGNNAKAIESLTEAGKTMKARRTSIIVFPEGTRTNRETPDLRQFKKGGFHLAVQSGIPIIPVVCQHYYHLYHKGVFGSGTLKIKGEIYYEKSPCEADLPQTHASSSTSTNCRNDHRRCESGRGRGPQSDARDTSRIVGNSTFGRSPEDLARGSNCGYTCRSTSSREAAGSSP